MTQTVSLRVEGMCCAEEVSALRREVESQPGVVSLSFDLLSARMNAVIDPSLAGADALARAVARTGMRATPWQEA
ncbi:MAG: heavy-metal-associated domain-containing protein, partial [Candidatus Sumerlaeia bacterium]|nr:heavy-metal-associated domain-containing protein [Candidatus Sumerlaeia bacterium]